MLETLSVIVAAAVVGVVLSRRRIAGSKLFQATVSPLASIMGSGFLVVAPLLAGAVGREAVLVMAALCAFAFAIGHIIRLNIVDVEARLQTGDDRVVTAASNVAKLLLGTSYVISVAFYLGLLSDLLVNELGIGGGQTTERFLTTAVLVAIALVAQVWGLGAVSRIERGVVIINLAMVAGLIAALIVDNGRAASDGTWKLPPAIEEIAASDIRQLLGILVVVQGFEISRYQAARFGAPIRIAAMRRAQLISATIYLVFIAALTHRFGEFEVGKDALLELVSIGGELTPLLPVLIVIAAIGSQLSASIADADGGAGLVHEATSGRVSTRVATLGTLAGAVALTWLTDVHQVIAIASRFFAAYYAMQIVLHVIVRRHAGTRWVALIWPLLLLAATVVVVVFALPSE